jgi:hypothetical protein
MGDVHELHTWSFRCSSHNTQRKKSTRSPGSVIILYLDYLYKLVPSPLDDFVVDNTIIHGFSIRMHQVVLNIDLAPTFLDIAGVKAPRSMDGVSIMKLFRRLKSQGDKPRVRRYDTHDPEPMIRLRVSSIYIWFDLYLFRKISHMWRDTFLIERGYVHIAILIVSKKKCLRYNARSDWSNGCNMSVYISEDRYFQRALAHFIASKYFIKAI